MMWKYTRTALVFLVTVLIVACNRQGGRKEYAFHPAGFYYKLLAFSTDTFIYKPDHVALVNAVFKTQNDSVFWDSFNNLNNRLYIHIDSAATNPFHRFVSSCSEADSACLLIKTPDFFSGQFKSDSIPFFSKKDSVVKIYFKITRILSPGDFNTLSQNLQKEEQKHISAYFGSDQKMEEAWDPLGFYWAERPAAATGPTPDLGNELTINYEGFYLNGRFLEKSNGDFEFIYGTPDQLLRGLNYALCKLKLGQTAKILLPSRLAFGESGSSNGIVPPYTPLLYKIKIIDIK